MYYVVTEGVRLTQQYACLRSASTRVLRDGGSSTRQQCAYAASPPLANNSLHDANQGETTACTTMVVAKSQRGIKASSTPQQNEVQWQRARAETLRTEERSVRMHKERLAP